MDQILATGQSVTLIHYVFQDNQERIACMPNMTEFHQTQHHPNYQRTNSKGAVTCPMCKKSKAFTGDKSHPDGE